MGDKYIKLKDYARYLEIEKGDIVFVSSDAKKMMWDAVKNKESADLNLFIDGLIAAVGEEGTVIFPTYNWDFCGGTTFDYKSTPCKTGTLGSIALKRTDFRRSKHPIYSFAVYGRYQDIICEMENKDSFGIDSPFAFFRDNNVKNYIIDVSLCHCFTFAHFAEQQSGSVDYRFVKSFTAGYIDEKGHESQQTFSMFVRKLDMNVETTIDPIEDDFIREGAESVICINNSHIKKIEMGKSYGIMLNDILNNKSRKLCTYLEQEE